MEKKQVGWVPLFSESSGSCDCHLCPACGNPTHIPSATPRLLSLHGDMKRVFCAEEVCQGRAGFPQSCTLCWGTYKWTRASGPVRRVRMRLFREDSQPQVASTVGGLGTHSSTAGGSQHVGSLCRSGSSSHLQGNSPGTPRPGRGGGELAETTPGLQEWHHATFREPGNSWNQGLSRHNP